MHVFCCHGFFPGFLFFHGFLGLLIFALLLGLIFKGLFGDSTAGGYHGRPAAGTGAFCAQCGAQFREAAPFCPHCGARRG